MSLKNKVQVLDAFWLISDFIQNNESMRPELTEKCLKKVKEGQLSFIQSYFDKIDMTGSPFSEVTDLVE